MFQMNENENYAKKCFVKYVLRNQKTGQTKSQILVWIGIFLNLNAYSVNLEKPDLFLVRVC